MDERVCHGPVALPAQPYNLWADLAAWRDAIRGVRENPLVTHLRLAESRRLKRTSGRRHGAASALVIALLAATAIFIAWPMLSIAGAEPAVTVLYSLAIVSLIIYYVWFMQGVFQMVDGALGVLGRYNKRPNHLYVDDFTCLSSLSDHEILAGAVYALYPPILLRILVAGAGLVLFMVAFGLFILLGIDIDTLSNLALDYYLSMDYDEFAALTVTASLLAVQIIVTGALAGLILILYFISLGRGLRVESFSPLAAGLVVISQVAGTYYITAQVVGIDTMPGGPYFNLTPNLGRLIEFFSLLLLPLAGLILGLARRMPSMRLAAAIAGPVIWPTLNSLSIGLLFLIVVANSELDFFKAQAHASLAAWLGNASMTLIAPLASLPVHYGILRSMTVTPDLVLRTGLVLLIQLGMLILLSRFALEAVGARRCRGD